MIKETDLRIGNIINVKTTNDEFNVVREIGFSDNQRGYYLRVDNINYGIWFEHNGDFLVEGVLLTKQWLIRFGFKLNSDEGDRLFYEKGKYGVMLVDGGEFCFYRADAFGAYTILIEVDYVHQIQNLYFALKSEELKTEK